MGDEEGVEVGEGVMGETGEVHGGTADGRKGRALGGPKEEASNGRRWTMRR